MSDETAPPVTLIKPSPLAAFKPKEVLPTAVRSLLKLAEPVTHKFPAGWQRKLATVGVFAGVAVVGYLAALVAAPVAMVFGVASFGAAVDVAGVAIISGLYLATGDLRRRERKANFAAKLESANRAAAVPDSVLPDSSDAGPAAPTDAPSVPAPDLSSPVAPVAPVEPVVPVAAEPVAAEPVAAEPVAVPPGEPAATEPVASEPATAEAPATPEPVAAAEPEPVVPAATSATAFDAVALAASDHPIKGRSLTPDQLHLVRSEIAKTRFWRLQGGEAEGYRSALTEIGTAGTLKEARARATAALTQLADQAPRCLENLDYRWDLQQIADPSKGVHTLAAAQNLAATGLDIHAAEFSVATTHAAPTAEASAAVVERAAAVAPRLVRRGGPAVEAGPAPEARPAPAARPAPDAKPAAAGARSGPAVEVGL